MICGYGCGQEAEYGPGERRRKWCCSSSYHKCPAVIEKKRNKLIGLKNPMYGKMPWNKGKKGVYSKETLKKMRKTKSHKGKTYEELMGFKKASKLKKIRSNHFSKIRTGKDPWNKGKTGIYTEETIRKIKSSKILTISKIKKKYALFSKIEEMRYNPNGQQEKEIQVHCKNNNCKNSKEKCGWFTPTKIQIYERIRQIEQDYGNGGCYFYCSNECKQECPLYNLKADPFRNINIPYTYEEYKTFRQYVLNRDNYICQFCEGTATDVHHERPQKLEPFFALDPDYAWSCCEKCHYEKGHKEECSTGNLAHIICI